MAPRKKKASPRSKKPGRKAPAKRAARKPVARSKAASATRVIERRKLPDNLRLRSLSVGLTVDDLARSLAWYRDVLGFVVKDEWRVEGKLEGVEIRAGAVDLFLGQDDWKKGRGRTKGDGLRIYGRTVQDIDRLAALIKSRGGVLSHEPRTQPWGTRDFGVVDPDGFRITFSAGA